MIAKEQETDDVITNLMFKSKAQFEQNKATITSDHKMNYFKVLDNPKSQQYTYVDALANLEELNELLRQRITDKNVHYNFFLDDSENPLNLKPINKTEYERYVEAIKRSEIYAYTIKDTWTKGKQFFFVQKGCLMKIMQLYNDMIFADIQFKDRIGLMKLEELRIVVPE